MIQVEPTTDHGSGRIVKDFSTFCENDVDPSLGKKIGTLIDSSKDYIIYLDEDYFVQWSYTEAYDSKVTKGFADIANRVRFLETLSRSELRDPQIDLFAGLLAEAMARIIGDRNEIKANASLKNAESYLSARGLENARSWYIMGSLVVSCRLRQARPERGIRARSWRRR